MSVFVLNEQIEVPVSDLLNFKDDDDFIIFVESAVQSCAGVLIYLPSQTILGSLRLALYPPRECNKKALKLL